MTESTTRFYDAYFCKNGGPTDIDLVDLTDLRTPGLLSEAQVREVVNGLSPFGTNQQEITLNLLEHITNCGDCTRIYQQQLKTSAIAKELQDALTDAYGVPARKRQ